MKWIHRPSYNVQLFWLWLLVPILGACNNSAVEPASAVEEAAVFEAGERVSLSGKDWAGVMNAHELELDRDRLRAATGVGRIEHFIRLPDGRELGYELQETEGSPPHTWRGRLYEDERARSSLTLSRSGERVTGGFRVEQRQYRIRNLEDGRVVLLELEHRDPPPHLPPRIPEETD